ncbi:hypothetical protein E1176_18510 [Fulvivirga sp. RKSG066]|uniref:TonB-dependent receptor plug domain-containing protein n=1 Tax=Fulvivirga aurantia TaxID=2529383 RepID=UPI0012BBC2C1|nr:TonB-dependent receptor [Fulvivirga aurantia]MTI23030.1 hypothetical protein [Fulvivirga aurantia]
MKKTILTLSMLAAVAFGSVQAQESEDIFEMSLEDLMEIDIYSVSKKKESLFDAPLSSSTITIDEIRNAGANSIPEALRLIPGVIVREMTNGNYDVHLRGLDNLSRYSDGATAGNQITLVMIDGRPVFNNNLGGIIWESLPVDLIDVERIEVVRGPSAPLYGPNAVAGVINIITKNIQEEGFMARAHGSVGTENTQVGGVSLGYNTGNFDVTLSGNIQQRDRMDNGYYSYAAGTYVDAITAPEAQGLFGDEMSLDKKGVNLFANYNVSEDIKFGLDLGHQSAEAQKPFRRNNFSPMSSQAFESTYANATMEVKNLRGRFSYTAGEDNLNSVPTSIPNGKTLFLKYKYTNIDTYLEYDFHINDDFSIRPGISYQRSTYGDEDFTSNTLLGAFNGEFTIRTFSGSLRADYNITDKWRVIAAGRVDQFTSPEEAYFSYQVASTFDINDKNLIRAVYAKSNSGSFLGQNFLNVSETYPIDTLGNQGIFQFTGNENLELFETQLIELGYRSKLKDNLELNLELFYQITDNSNDLINQPAPAGYVQAASLVAQFENLDLRATQMGATVSFNYVPNVKWQIKPYVTFQKTETEDLPVALNSPDLDPVNNVEVTTTEDNEQTPGVFGGFYLNYQPTNKLNFNINTYYLADQTQYSSYDLANPANTAGDIDSKYIVNAKVNYNITDNFSVFVNGRNLLNNDNVEYYAADRNGMLVLGGLSVKL